MQDGRFSTIRFNEWICITSQYEKAVARIGRQVYQGYSRGLLEDYPSIEICKEISETFSEARLLRAELEEELERDALDGLNLEEARKADEHRKLTQAQLTKRNLKLKMTKFLGRQSINRSVAAHRDQVRNLSRDLGLRALACFADEPLLKVRGHKSLCLLAERLNDEADKKWQEIVAINKTTGGGLSFHTILINFVVNFASFSKGTALGKFLLKFFKYDEEQEKDKLSKQFEGSKTATALKAQMEEIDEPHLDVGREMDNLQQEYEETPVEWNLSGDTYNPDDLDTTPEYTESPVEKWEPEADTWNPDASADEDFLDAVEQAPFLPEPVLEPEPEPEPPPPPAGPTLLRHRGEPEAEAWKDESPSLKPPGNRLPQVGMAPSASPTTKSEDDWGWDEPSSEEWSNTQSEDSFATSGPPSLSAPNPLAAKSQPASEPDSFAPPSQPTSAPDSFAPMSQPTSAPDSFAPPSQPTSASDPFAPPSQPTSASDPFAPMNPSTSASDPFAPMSDEADPFAEGGRFAPPDAFSSTDQGSLGTPAGDPLASKPIGKRPPFVKSADEERPLGDWTPQESRVQPSSPSKSAWGEPTPSDDYGWSTPAASTVPDKIERTPEPEPPTPPASPSPEPRESESDSFLRLMRDRETPAEPEIAIEEDLGDDLLPAFLMERNDEDSALEEDTFIPELPSFLASEDGPQLEIVPFGSRSDEKAEETPKADNTETLFPPETP